MNDAVEVVLTAALESGAIRADFTAADLALLVGGVPDGEEQALRCADLVLTGILRGR